MANYFFFIFFLTILCTRVFLFLWPTPGPTIGKFRIHHYIYGILGVLLGLIFHSVIIYAIGLGLFVDELTYLLIRGKNHQDNYSKTSLVGTFIFVILVFLFQDYFVLLLN